MQKKLILVLCVILVGLSFSCSEYILPKRVEITGTVNLPVKVGVMDFNMLFLESIQYAFASDGDEIEVYNVDYEGQTVQTFCIYFPIEMTENLNPTDFLKTINKQINHGISSEPRKIEPIVMPVPPGGQIPISHINVPDINPIYLDNIAKYVLDIDFDKCDGTENSGIGLNLYLDEIIDGLEMAIVCNDVNLKFSVAYKPLQKGDNIFGNEEDTTLELVDEDDKPSYQNRLKSLRFTMHLRSAGPNKDMLDLNAAGLMLGDRVTIMKGEVRFFQNWTEAEIDMRAAMKAEYKEEGFVGSFPPVAAGDAGGGFDLSGLGNFLHGGFTFDGLETKMYMDNPVSFEMDMELDPQYTGKKEAEESVEPLYKGEFSVDKNAFVLSNHLENGNYLSEHLPGIDGEYNDANINQAVIADIFDKMPHDLIFQYKINFEETHLKVTPDMFSEEDKISEDSKSINMALMIMLPLRLNAQDGSTIMIPGMFNNVTLGMDESVGSSVKIQNIRMTIDFLSPIFSGGSLFIDGENSFGENIVEENSLEENDDGENDDGENGENDVNGVNSVNDPKLFFPDGIMLGGTNKKKDPKRIVVNFSKKELEIIQDNLIKPNIWIKFKEGDTIHIPKNLGVLGIKFEMKGIQIGDVFFK